MSKVKKLVIGATVAAVIGAGAFTLVKVNKDKPKEYSYFSDVLEENADNTYMDELFSEGITIKLDDEDVALKTAVDKIDAANRIYEVLKEYIEESNDSHEKEITDEEKQKYIDEYKNSGKKDIEYINELIEEYENTEDGFEKAKQIRKLKTLEDYFSEFSDKYGTQVLDKVTDLMFNTAATQAYGFEDIDAYKDYAFDSEYESGMFNGKVIMEITDEELSGHTEKVMFNGDIFGKAGAYVDLYKARKSMDIGNEHDKSIESMREYYDDVLDSAKEALEVNPEKQVKKYTK